VAHFLLVQSKKAPIKVKAKKKQTDVDIEDNGKTKCSSQVNVLDLITLSIFSFH